VSVLMVSLNILIPVGCHYFPVPFLIIATVIFSTSGVIPLWMYFSWPKSVRQQPEFKATFAASRKVNTVQAVYILITIGYVAAYIFLTGFPKLFVLALYNFLTFFSRYVIVRNAEKCNLPESISNQVFMVNIISNFATGITLPSSNAWYIYVVLFASKTLNAMWPFLLSYYYVKQRAAVHPIGVDGKIPPVPESKIYKYFFSFSSLHHELINAFFSMFGPVVATIIYLPIIIFYNWSAANKQYTIYYYVTKSQVTGAIYYMIGASGFAILVFIVVRIMFLRVVRTDPLLIGIADITKNFWMYFTATTYCVYFVTALNLRQTAVIYTMRPDLYPI